MMDFGASRPWSAFDNERFALVHGQGERLEHEMVAVAVDDHAGEAIAFTPDEPAELRVDAAPRPIVDGELVASAAEEKSRSRSWRWQEKRRSHDHWD